MFKILFVIVPIFIGIVFVFTIAIMVSPKLRGKWMGQQIKAAKYMLDENEENLKDMATKTANISKDGVTITSRAIKDGLKGNSYCKYCGNSIDSDSKYCNNCGKKL